MLSIANYLSVSCSAVGASQIKVLSMNFKAENFMDDQLTTKAAEVAPLKNLHGSYMAIAIIDRYIYDCFLLPIFSLLM